MHAAAKTAPLSEQELQQQVTELAGYRGWEWMHIRSARTKDSWRTPVSGTLGAGFPDLVLVRERDHQLLFVELKRDGAKLAAAQERVLDVLGSVIQPDTICGEGPHEPNAAGEESRLECCPVRIEVYVWRPVDWPEIERVLA